VQYFSQPLQALILDNDLQIISLYYQLCASVLIKCFACDGSLWFLRAAGCKYVKGGGGGDEILGNFQMHFSLQRKSERRMSMGLVYFRGRLPCYGI
jgi:hypothetical protein